MLVRATGVVIHLSARRFLKRIIAVSCDVVDGMNEDGEPVIAFDDGFTGAIDRVYLAAVIEKRPTQSTLF